MFDKISIPNITRKTISKIIRVDHAGEMGACFIYKGQLAAAKLRKYPTETIKQLEHMLKQEKAHYSYFCEKIFTIGIRPTALSPVWQLGGYLMGFITAIIGVNSAMNCTISVEKVIDEHYQEQLSELSLLHSGWNDHFFRCGHSKNKAKRLLKIVEELKQKIEFFRLEEIEHKNLASEYAKCSAKNLNENFSLIEYVSIIAIYVAKRI